jgi:hypothetical protein
MPIASAEATFSPSNVVSTVDNFLFICCLARVDADLCVVNEKEVAAIRLEITNKVINGYDCGSLTAAS